MSGMADSVGLRDGATTGTTAAAAALAALELGLSGIAPGIVPTPLPPIVTDRNNNEIPSGWRHVAIERAWETQAGFAGAAIKDAGDDPDVTNGLRIIAELSSLAEDDDRGEFFVKIEGGEGIGRVTKPGLALPPGSWAINPGPLAQIRFGLKRRWLQLRDMPFAGRFSPPYRLVVSAPDGLRISQETMNPRLGVMGGISILGSCGIVRPFSAKAWQNSIEAALNVAKGSGLETACLTTGRVSSRLCARFLDELPPQAFIEAGDWAGYALNCAHRLGFKKIFWGCFFGKLIKLAQGLCATNVRDGALDLAFIMDLCASDAVTREVASCNTAREALDYLLTEPGGDRLITRIATLAKERLELMAAQKISLLLFHPDGRLLEAL